MLKRTLLETIGVGSVGLSLIPFLMVGGGGGGVTIVSILLLQVHCAPYKCVVWEQFEPRTDKHTVQCIYEVS